MEELWFLLFDGQSEDGMGQPSYSGRTTDPETAKRHFEKCQSDPYCTGKVLCYDNSKLTLISQSTNWDEL